MIGKLLKQFTIDTGISQKEVAEKLSYSPQRVNNYYRDIAEAPHEFLEKFRTTFSVDLKALLDKEKKGAIAGVASYNPIPVFDLELKPIKDLDFFNHSELVSYYIDAPMFNDCFAAVKVPGKSMEPSFTPADVVAIKRITNFDTIPYGEFYFIITDEHSFIRCIRKADDAKKIILRASNPDYDEMTIKKADIRYLFHIRGKITRF